MNFVPVAAQSAMANQRWDLVDIMVSGGICAPRVWRLKTNKKKQKYTSKSMCYRIHPVASAWKNDHHRP
jgi:hypothetical protein